jgi:N2-acetyl-L-2,4-diaminobutanoate deacetylase
MSEPVWIDATPDRLDFASEGLRRYLVRLDYRTAGGPERLAWPLVVCRQGAGPAALVCGGTHGDEFEGQFAALRLIDRLRPDRVRGLLMVAPTVNRPACLAGTRRSPIDGLDINRVFAGEAGDGPSPVIARFVIERLLPQVEAVLDIHSGGEAMEFVLSSNLQAAPGSAEFDRALPALLAFDAPYAIIFDEGADAGGMPHRGTLEGAARALGKLALSSELGGGGRVTPASMRVAEDGLRNLLSHLGLVPDPSARSAADSRSVLLALARPECHVAAPTRAHFLPWVALGDAVAKGAVLAELHRLDEPGWSGQAVRAAIDGIVVAVARRGVADPGEPLVYLAEPLRR